VTSAHHPPLHARTAAIIVIGNEVLSGKVEDINSRYLLKELYQLGVRVQRVITIPDELETIAEEVRKASAQWDYVFTSGGVGPTHDDVTFPGVARAFGVPLVEHPDLLKLVQSHFKHDINDAARRLSRIPEGTELLYEGNLIYPLSRIHNVYVFPGVPEMLRTRFEAVKERFREAPYFLIRIFTQQGESVLAAHLEDTLIRFSGLEIGSYPRFDCEEYRVELTMESKDPALLARARDHLLSCMDDVQVVRIIDL